MEAGAEMNLSALLPALRTLPEYPGLLEHIGRSPVALGLPRAARLAVVAALAAELQRPALLIAARSDRALLFNEELPAWLPSNQQSHSASLRGLSSAISDQPSAFNIHHFPEPNPLPYEHAPWGPRTIRQRIATLASLVAPRPADSSFILHTALQARIAVAGPSPFIITSARALLTRTLPRRDYLAAARTLRIGQSIRLDKLLESWIGAGYTSDTIVSEPGQFSRRGGIVDVWPPADTYPTRIELFGDDVRLEQVLINYLTNAIKYSPDHKEVQLHVEVSPEQEIIVKVSDKGVGIPIEKQDKLFQKFFRVEDTSHRFQGLGIGLYICAEIIRRHNGTFGVVSEPGRGSTFYFSIPAAHQSKEQLVTSTS